MKANNTRLRCMWMVTMATSLAGGVAYFVFNRSLAERARSAMIGSNQVSTPAKVNGRIRHASPGAASANVTDQLTAVENAVAALTLTASPTSAQADAVEAALAGMAQNRANGSRAAGSAHRASDASDRVLKASMRACRTDID